MAEHYPKNCIEASAWCNGCGMNTPHRVADKRLQYCIPCYGKASKGKPERPPCERPGDLFTDMAVQG